jgi:asparagine synthase (glutamine-hydrolysing)
MCGFAGYLSTTKQTDSKTLKAMGEAIVHRGPDSGDIWFNKELNIGLVHQRLAIQDLSPHGNQPMTSKNQRYIIAFNGEIYNFNDIRAELEPLGHSFTGHSDTEVMLAAFEQWGLEKSLTKFAGMFAFALVDLQEKELILARDRMGEKPLYFGNHNECWLFGSELKALKQHNAWQGDINRNALPLLLRHNFIPAPHTIYKNTYKLLPSTFVRISLENQQLIETKKYWSLESCFTTDNREYSDFKSASTTLEEKLNSVIAEQMISDAPLGAFLSGGIDSSTTAALMQRQSDKKIKTFTIGFSEPEYNEAEHAKAVAKHIGSDHTELYVSGKDALNLIPNLPQIYDEPFADSSQLPTFLLCKMTKEKVTVALSGDGGDELFCGYTRYMQYAKQWQQRSNIKNKLKNAALNIPTILLANASQLFISSQKHLSLDTIIDKIEREKTIAKTKTISEFYKENISYWIKPEAIITTGTEPNYSLSNEPPEHISHDLHKTMMWQDLNWYLPDDILVKVDRAAMANSLETRVPMLDHRIVEFALGLPIDFNIKGNTGKQLLRSVLFRHVPKELIERPKVGFAIPKAKWLREDLRDWAEALLNEKRLEKQGFWNSKVVRQKWLEHLSGEVDFSFQLWSILMFQSWLDDEKTSQLKI